MNKITFTNNQEPGISKEILDLLQENIEKAIHGTTLFEIAGGTLNNITLSDSAVNFVRMKFYYHTNDNKYCSLEIANPNGKSVSLSAFFSNYADSYLKQRVINIAGSSITNTSDSYETTVIQHTIANNNKIYIDKIIGFKD